MPMNRRAVLVALPSLSIALLLFLCIFDKAFTTDDYFYLREAEQAIKTPLNPLSVVLTWDRDLHLNASEYAPTGPGIAYLLVPTVLTHGSEFVAHLTQILVLCLAILGMVRLSLRVGLTHWQAAVATLLVVCSPALLGMAATNMPDVPALCITVFAMELLFAWKQERRWIQAAGFAILIGLAVITRSHAVGLLIVAAVAVTDIRKWWPIAAALGCAALLVHLTTDRSSSGKAAAVTFAAYAAKADLKLVVRNGIAFLADWVLTTTFVLGWIACRGRALVRWQMTGILPAVLVFLWRFPDKLVVAVSLGLFLIVFVDLVLYVWQERSPEMVALFLWLGLALPGVFFMHMAPRYLVLSLPAAAILIARNCGEAQKLRLAAVCVAGLFVGAMVIHGDARSGAANRFVAQKYIAPRTASGQRVWSVGHHGYQFYAEKAGAQTFALDSPQPLPGDIFVVNRNRTCTLGDSISLRATLLESAHFPYHGPHTMTGGAGFFSSGYGFLPFVWKTLDTTAVEVYRIDR